MQKSIAVFALVVVVALVAGGAQASCHNSTGACHLNGKFECMDGSLIPWAQRCDGQEDCMDGMDEFMCPHSARHHHEVHEQASCGPTCNCLVGTTTVTQSSIYWTFATQAPTWSPLITDAPSNGIFGCNPNTAKTTSINMNWYKKGATAAPGGTGNCIGNVHKRGFICCGRQTSCNCGTGAAPHCT